MGPSDSVSFDRASRYYDRTRALEQGAMEEVVERIAPELRDLRCLEIGVGTGRFALPLRERGIDLVGVDLSRKMLERLVRNAGGASPVPLAVADATRLPFPDSSFGGALAVHVLHLIPNWEVVLDELVRILAPGGRFILDPGGWGQGIWREAIGAFCEGAGIEMRHPGINDGEEVDAAMAARGARVRLLPSISTRTTETFGELIDGLEEGMFSFTWRVDQAARDRGAGAARAWLAKQGHDPSGTPDVSFEIQLRVYDL